MTESRTPALLFVSLLIVFALPSAAYADGKAFGGKFPDFTTLYESEQVAAIAHHEGVQRMMIAVKIAMEREDRGLWVLPIPASATDVTVDLLDTFPRFDGDDPKMAVSRINDGFAYLRLPHFWPIFLDAIFTLTNTLGGPIDVHATAQKWGLRSEVIETDSKAALLDYIHSHDIQLASRELDSFDPYFEGKHSFVATWIDSFEEVQAAFPQDERSLSGGRWPSLLVTFPTEEIYYPMLASRWEGETSGKRSLRMWVKLAIVGHVMEAVDDGMKPIHEHMMQPRWPTGSPTNFTEGLPTRNIPYTAVWNPIDMDQITRDYRFAPYNPPGMDEAILVWRITNWFRHPVSLVSLFAVLSVLCASFTGWTMYGDWKAMAWIGLWNFTTLLGLGFALAYHGLSSAEQRTFLVRFSLLFVFGSLLVQFLLIYWLHLTFGADFSL